MEWSHGYLTKAVLRPANSGEYKITGKNIAIATVTDSEGKSVTGESYNGYVSAPTGKTANDYAVLNLEGGKTYTITGFDNQEDVAGAKAALTTLISEANAEQEKNQGNRFDADAEVALTAAIETAPSGAQRWNVIVRLD